MTLAMTSTNCRRRGVVACQAIDALDQAAFRPNRPNTDNVIDSNSVERARSEKPDSTFSQRALKQELDGLYRAHARKLRGYARRRVGSQEAEDLVHDVYLRLLQQNEVASLERPREYLYRIAENLAIDSARKVRRRSRFANEDLEFLTFQARAPSPEEIVDGVMELRRLRVFVKELPATCQNAFLLSRVNGLTHEEIARRLGVSVRTVERRIAKAIKELRRRLAHDVYLA